MSQRKEDGMKYFRIGGDTYVAGPTDLLGKGTYGIVYRVHNERDASIKKAIKTFSPDSMDENDGIPSTTLREINAMMTLDHPNVMKAQDVVFPKDGSMIDMFVVMELCKGTLKDKLAGLIQEHLKNDFRWTRPTPDMTLPVEYVRQAKIISYQLLNALAVLHSRGIMHRDLKPVNIMWGFDDLLKLGDFGLARFVRGNQNSSDSVMPQTGEVQTMWYRAPEVLLGDERYGLKVDDWSIGCIIAEMFRFYRSSSGRIMASPLFAGKSDVETLLMIFDALGTPDPSTSASGKYLESLPNWSKEYPKWTPTLRQRVPLIDETGFDLLTQLLCTSPFDRQAAKFLLQHAWFNDVREECKRFVPWYRGFEEGYKRMVAVNRLPRAQPLSTQAGKLNNDNAKANANGGPAAAATRSVSGPHTNVRSKVGNARGDEPPNRAPSARPPSDTNAGEPAAATVETPNDAAGGAGGASKPCAATGRLRGAGFAPATGVAAAPAVAVSRTGRKATGPAAAAAGLAARQYTSYAKQPLRKKPGEVLGVAAGVAASQVSASSQEEKPIKPPAQRQKRAAADLSGNETIPLGAAVGQCGVRLRGVAPKAAAVEEPVGKRLRHAPDHLNHQRLLDSYVTRVGDNKAAAAGGVRGGGGVGGVIGKSSKLDLDPRSDSMSDVSTTTGETLLPAAASSFDGKAPPALTRNAAARQRPRRLIH